MKQLKDFTDLELKALAYDQIKNIEIAKANLANINQELDRRNNEKIKSE